MSNSTLVYWLVGLLLVLGGVNALSMSNEEADAFHDSIIDSADR